MRQRILKKEWLALHVLTLFGLVLSICSFTGCKDDKANEQEYDPSKPIIFTDFSPKEGAVRTRLFITGDNIGTDVSRIQVFVGGKQAKVIGSDGKQVYCMVPKRAYDKSVIIQVLNANGEVAVEHKFEEEFTYTAQTTVGTLIRKVDENGNASAIDGSFDVASIDNPDWMMFQSKPGPNGYKELFISKNKSHIRKIDLLNETISTVITNAQAMCNNMQKFCFTAEGDTLFLSDDNGQATGTAKTNLFYMLRSEQFRKSHPYLQNPTSYNCVSHPQTHALFFNTYQRAAILKDKGQRDANGILVSKPLFELSNFGTAFTGHSSTMVIHPSGNYMYIFPNKYSCVLKSNYNWTTNEFEYPSVFAGAFNQQGYQDGVGTSARFNYAIQGVFVKNKEYEAAGMIDIYDLYVTDQQNHCIRKITPDGIVTTFAGRGSSSSDGKVYGYVDGDPLKEARFYGPTTIAYDEEIETFYIGETTNHSIRYIATE